MHKQVARTNSAIVYDGYPGNPSPVSKSSIENNVTRAIALALLIENKTTGTKISKVKGKYQLMAISNQAFPKLNQYNHKLKKAQEKYGS